MCTRRRGAAYPGDVESSHQFSTRDLNGTLFDGDEAHVDADVVVVSAVGPRGYADPAGEGVQFIKVGVTDQVAEKVPAPRPDCRINEECHGFQGSGG